MNKSDLLHMRLAIKEARRSKAEEDDLAHPQVGVVVARGGQVLASACRGDIVAGDHAEFTALEKKLSNETIAGATVYTTLEPCTTRNHPKVPCAARLFERRVGRVVIGMLDPDQRITGRGILRLRNAGIAVDLFPPDLMAELEELNREFIRDRTTVPDRQGQPPGLIEAGISAFYPSRDYYAKLRTNRETIDRYVATADSSLVMISISLGTGLRYHDLCLCLERKLAESGGEFRIVISLLDPRRPELMQVMAPVLNISSVELRQNILNNLSDLAAFKMRLSQKEQGQLELRVHTAIPFASAILLDHELNRGRIQLETKPYKAGLQKSFAFEVNRSGSAGFYETLAHSFEALLQDGQIWEPDKVD